MNNKILSINELIAIKKNIKKVFFYRVCGTGMGAAACLLREAGFEVEGGDYNFYPPMSDYLSQTGISLHNLSDFDHEKLKEYDLIVVGNVVPNGSEQAISIEQSAVHYTSFPTALGALVLKDVNVIGIAGTHGKTTTTYFLTQILENLGEDPGYFIGGVLDNRPSSKLGEGKFFIIESDEYDCAYFQKISKFREYQINTLILTSLEFDHADIFSSIEDIKDEFRSIYPSLKESIIHCSDYSAANELGDEFKITENSYGTKNLKVLKENSSGTQFSLNGVTYKTDLIGLHNIQNLSACILLLLKNDFNTSQINKAIENLSLVKRRQEFRGLYKEAIVIDDFAHHPTAVEKTLEAIKTKYSNKKIISILEPNSATARSALFEKRFEKSLLQSDQVIIAKPQRASSLKGVESLNCSLICENLNREGVRANEVTDLKQLKELINKEANKESLFLIMSNGTCLDLWKSDFVNELN